MCNQMHEAHRRRATADVAAPPPQPPRPSVPGQQVEEIDDESPVWTFRVMLLGSISFVFLLILNKYFLNQTAEFIMGMASTLVVLYPLGYIMGKLIPTRTVYYPMFGLEFSMNSGSFGIREYAMISIFANVGAILGVFTSYSVDWFDN
ncbi:hypothetical protein ABFS82_03G025700 [Erythranthe guttata]